MNNLKNKSIVNLSEKAGLGPIFLGKSDQVIRVDIASSELPRKLKEESEANTWFAKEVNYDSDSTRFEELSAIEKRMFQLNIGYQTVMDSGASNGYLDTFRKVTTDQMWKMVFTRIGMEEVIHAESYSFALSQMFGSKAEEFLDVIYTDKFIQKRMENEIDAFDQVDRLVDSGVDKDSIEMKKAVLRMIVAVYLLEGIKFPFSFYVTWNINIINKNAIQGISRLLRFIAHDEFSFHVTSNLHVLKILRRDQSQGFKELFDSGWFEEMTHEMTKFIVEEELEWMNYLLKDGAIQGFNNKIGDHFIKYWANKRLQGLKLPTLYDEKIYAKNDIIEWYDTYRDLNKVDSAIQEADNMGYQKGGLANDLDKVFANKVSSK